MGGGEVHHAGQLRNTDLLFEALLHVTDRPPDAQKDIRGDSAAAAMGDRQSSR